MVRAGTVEPTALYREPWTQGEWRAVTDLPLFHRLSPTPHALGPRLLKRQRERDAFQLHWMLYHQSSFLERQLWLTPLGQFARESDAQVASRLFILPSFFPESIVSIAFQGDRLIVSGVDAPSSLWGSRGPRRQISTVRP